MRHPSADALCAWLNDRTLPIEWLSPSGEWRPVLFPSLLPGQVYRIAPTHTPDGGPRWQSAR